MAEHEKFYRVNDYADKVIPGDKIHIEHSIFAKSNSAEMAQLTTLPLDELQTMREASAAAEQTIFENLREAAREWDTQAAQTLQLDMAIEYARTPPVKHTANEWVKNDYDWQERSNMVYKMQYHIYENTKYDRDTKTHVPTSWDLTWNVSTNNPDRRNGHKIAGQSRKSFKDKGDMEKYLAGRIKAHEQYFTEVSPPVPQQYAGSFRVNGQLLPGYTVQGAEPKIEHDTIAPGTTEPNAPAIATTESPAQTAEQDTTQTKAAVVAAAPFVLVSDNPKEKLAEITGKLEAGVKGIFESEQYKKCLDTFSKFHNYSVNNCLLIAMQKPNATHVGGFNFWRDEMKRPVMKGEKGIKIIAPAPFKTKKQVDRLDTSGKPITDKDGKRLKDEVEVTIPAFKVATVFDVSQTDGEPLPQLGVSELTGSVDKYKELFAALEKASPVPINFEPIKTGAKGYYHQMEKRIAINEGMSELQSLKTAIHEIAHAKLHAIDTEKPLKGQDIPDRRTREVEAESIAYTVCQHYGLDTSDYSFGYVAGWSGGKELDTLKSSLDTIRKEAGAIITEVDKHFAELTQDKEQTAELPAPEQSAPAPTIDLKAVADYMQKQNDTIQAAAPDKVQGQAAFNMAVKRLDKASERIPGDEHPQLKALITNAAQSPDLQTLKERMNTLQEFTQHYSTAVQNTIDTSGKAEPPAAAPTRQTDPAPKPPAQGENVAAIEAKVNAGEVINLTDLSDAIKKDKQAAQIAQSGRAAQQTAKTGTRGKGTNTKQQQPSIREQIAAGKKQLENKQKSAPQKTATINKNTALEA